MLRFIELTLSQGLEQSSFSGSPGQRLLLSKAPPAAQQSGQEVVTPRLKGREMYGGIHVFKIRHWDIS